MFLAIDINQGANRMIKLKQYINKIMVSNSVLLSIGANDGVFVDELYQSNLLNAEWKCFFVEPVPDTFNKLINNYNKDYPSNSFVFINNAINTYDGHGFLVTNKADDSMGMCSFFRSETDDTIKIPVVCTTIETLFKEYNIPTNIDFLKIDTEGMDYEIVAQCIKNNIFPKIILLEHISLNNDLVTTYTQMISMITPFYTIIEDIPEYQYEEANILLIDNNYV